MAAKPLKRLTRCTIPALLILLGAASAHADSSYRTLPFFENWTNTSRLSQNDNWSNVPGIVGYLGDVTTQSVVGVLPRTIVGDSTTSVDVIVNQTDPSSLDAGGVAEFELANPVVGLQGSATADHPYLVIHLNTTANNGPIVFQCKFRDIDGSTDDAVQLFQVQYRTQPSGPWTNAPGGDCPDVTLGPNSATMETIMSIVLPGIVSGRPQLQIRIMTANAVGNDEWVGVDDILITSAVAGVPAVPVPGALQRTTWSGVKTLLRGR